MQADGLHGEDLGAGVYASPAENGELVVTSSRLDLGLKVAGGRVPGTAVVWSDQPFEVVARAPAGKGHRWFLKPWDDAGAMRDVVRLDAAFVASVAARAAAQRRGERYRFATMALLPLLGLAPARVQERWESEWLFPAELATWVSSALELLAGATGLIQALAMAYGGEWFLPPFLRFLAIVGPLMSFEAIGRLVFVAAGQGPIGSVVGLPIALVEKPVRVETPANGPQVRSLDDDRGVLELVSPINRIDWGHEGLLPFRDGWYALDRADREGRNWTYRFTRCEDPSESGHVLRLHPPVAKPFVATRHAAPPPSILRTTLVTAAVTLGPRVDQERWAGHLGVNPKWLTMAAAAAELVGGLANLGRDASNGGVLLIALDVWLIVEGSVRLLSAVGGRAMGSVFGIVLRPLYRSSLPPTR